MATPRYAADQRTTRDVLASLALAARGAALPASLADPDAGLRTWADLLFRDDDLRNTLEPSQRLLEALARLVSTEGKAGLARHFDELPSRALRWYLEQRLGIGRLPPAPDRVALVAEGDPKRLPATLPRGTVVVAGTDARGAERRYATTEEVTVLGASVAALHSHRVLRGAGGEGDVVVRRAAEAASEPDQPYHPFGDAAEPAATHAPHEIYVASRLLAATAGTLTARLTFDGVDDTAAGKAVLESLRWEVPTSAGYAVVVPTVVARSSERAVEVELGVTGEVAAVPVGGTTLPHVRARFPDPGSAAAAGFSRDAAYAFAFSGLRLTAAGEGLPPDGGLYNGGVLDLTKEFQPFGPVPRRGDSFFLRLDQAFSKPLARLSVNLEMLQRGDAGGAPVFVAVQYLIWGGYGAGYVASSDQDTSRLVWQAFRDGRWRDQFEDTDFRSISGSISDHPVFSQRAEVGGIEGHFVRAFLFRGDFGWEDYLEEMADNATKIAKGEGNQITGIRPPPDPPVVTRVTVGYETHERSASSPGDEVVLLSRNALGAPARLEPTGSALRPFVEQPDGSRGVLYLGLNDVPPGEVATLFFDIEEASACDSMAGGGSLAWEYRAAGGEWPPVDVIDGTLGLRQSGIMRVATRADWATGAPEVDETGARWLRARTDAPQLAGRIRRIAPDAVEAEYAIPPAHLLDDTTPETPIEAETAKGPKAAVPGVKKLTNPVRSHGGRGPEPDERYFERAASVTRHRDRAVTPWDVEAIVRAGFPDVAMLRCLPHRSYDSARAPGWLAVVVVPRSDALRPQPSVRLAAEVQRAVAERASSRLRVAVLCPAYAEVRVEARLQLRPGFAAASARDAIDAAVRGYLHPLGRRRASGFGRGLALSEVARLFEERPEVDFVREVRFGGAYASTEYIEVDPQVGLVASADEHDLQVEVAL